MTIHSRRAACELFWWSLSMSSISCKTCNRVASQRQHTRCRPEPAMPADISCCKPVVHVRRGVHINSSTSLCSWRSHGLSV